jgi:hypothetical protein
MKWKQFGHKGIPGRKSQAKSQDENGKRRRLVTITNLLKKKKRKERKFNVCVAIDEDFELLLKHNTIQIHNNVMWD